MTRETLLLILSGYYLAAGAFVTLATVMVAKYSFDATGRLGRGARGQQLMALGNGLPALAWLFFMAGIVPDAVNPLDAGERIVCLLAFVTIKLGAEWVRVAAWQQHDTEIRRALELGGELAAAVADAASVWPDAPAAGEPGARD